MPTSLVSPRPSPSARTIFGRPLTGRAVLVWFLAFFGVVFAVNGVMVRYALTTFGGVETESSYKAGLNFKRDTADADAQEARHWQVSGNLAFQSEGGGRGEARAIIKAFDAAGRPLTGLTAKASLHHPTDARRDHAIVLAEAAPGVYEGMSAATTGQWDLRIDLERGGERLFRSKSRIQIQ